MQDTFTHDCPLRIECMQDVVWRWPPSIILSFSLAAVLPQECKIEGTATERLELKESERSESDTIERNRKFNRIGKSESIYAAYIMNIIFRHRMYRV